MSHFDLNSALLAFLAFYRVYTYKPVRVYGTWPNRKKLVMQPSTHKHPSSIRLIEPDPTVCGTSITVLEIALFYGQ